MKKTILLTALVLVARLGLYAQCPGCSANTSGALITSDLYFKRAMLFPTSEVFTAVDSDCGFAQPFNVGTYKLDDFLDLLNVYTATDASGIKIYFGRLSQTGNAFANRVAKDYENILIPIFVATRRDAVSPRHDVGDYYVFDPHTGALVPIAQDAAQAWYRNYLSTPSMPAMPTRTLFYKRQLLTDFRSDIECQRKCNKKIKDIVMTWGIYEEDVPDQDHPTGTWATKNKLTLLFNIPYAFRRVTPMANLAQTRGDGSYDTAAPCPPASNCDEPGDGLKP